MPDVTIPHTFTNGAGNVIDATQVNANFVALRDAVNDLTIDNLASALRELLVPTGALLPFGGSAAPSGFLLADGSVVSRTTYAALFAVVGTSFNTGGEAGTDFRLPNLKGKVPVGLDAAQTEFDTRGEAGGAKAHTLAIAEMPLHAHTIQDSAPLDHAHSGDGLPNYVMANGTVAPTGAATGGATVPGGSGGGGSATNFTAASGTGLVSGSLVHAHGCFNTGGGGSHNNLQPYQVANYIIKT